MSLTAIYGELARMTKIGGGSSSPAVEWDTDALAFIVAKGEADITRQNAYNRFFKTLKSKGLWNRIVCGYFFGESEAQSKWNFKDPLDTDAAKRLLFFGDWEFDDDAAIPNGVDTYAVTYLDCNEDVPMYSFHGAVYQTENTLPVEDYTIFGVKGLNNGIRLDAFDGNKLYTIMGGENEQAINTTAQASFDKMLVATCYHAEHMNIYREGVSLGSYTGEQYGYFPNRDTTQPRYMTLGAMNANATIEEFSYAPFSFACFGFGLTQAMVVSLKNAYNKFRADVNLPI